MTSAIREYFSEFVKRHGKAITIYSFSRSYTTYYDTATTTYTESSSTYGLVIPEKTDFSSEQPGQLKSGVMVMLIPYDKTVANGYKITYDGEDYKVRSVSDYHYGGDVVAKMVEIKRMGAD